MENLTPLDETILGNIVEEELTYNQQRAKKWADYQKAYQSNYRKEYYETNKEKMIENALKWNKDNSDKQKEIHKKWYQSHREIILEKQRARKKSKEIALIVEDPILPTESLVEVEPEVEPETIEKVE